MLKKLKVFILLTVFVSMLTSSAYAYEFDSYADPQGDIYLNDIEIPPEKVLFSGNTVDISASADGLIVVMGMDVKLDGVYNADVFVFGSNVSISGTFNENLYVFGSRNDISADVKGTLYSASQNLTFSGNVDKDFLALSSSLSLRDKSSVERDFIGLASNLTLDGAIGRNAKNFGMNVTINGLISGNTYNYADNVVLGSDSSFEGSVYSSGQNEPIIQGSPSFKYEPSWREVIKTTEEKNSTGLVLSYFMRFIGIFAMWFIIKTLFPRFYERSDYIASKKGLESFALGVGMFFLTIIGALVFLFINAALSGSLVFFYFGIVFASSAIFLTALASLISKKYKIKDFLSMAIVTSVYIILSSLTIYNLYIYISLIVIILGTGYFIYNIIADRQEFKNLLKQKPVMPIDNIPNFPHSN